jgi:hypothetical protein
MKITTDREVAMHPKPTREQAQQRQRIEELAKTIREAAGQCEVLGVSGWLAERLRGVAAELDEEAYVAAHGHRPWCTCHGEYEAHMADHRKAQEELRRLDMERERQRAIANGDDPEARLAALGWR